MSNKTVAQQHKRNFDTLTGAFKNGDVALMECVDKTTGEFVAVICATAFDEKAGDWVITPFAAFPNDNPYERFLSAMDIDENTKEQIDG